MSAQLSKIDILFDQRMLSCGGFYNGRLDGLYGPKTRAAEDAGHAAYLDIQHTLGAFDPRSERNIATLLPAMQKKARAILTVAKSREPLTGLRCQILSGTRSYDEQARLYAQRPKVTNAGPGSSNHNFGIAIDLGLFDGMHYLTGSTPAEERSYADLAYATKDQVHGIEWGGDWHSLKDMPHYQLATGKTLREVREAFEQGVSYA